MSTIHGTRQSYIAGFGLSIALTLTAYFAVEYDLLTGTQAIAAIVALAVVQAIVQLVFFLHLDREARPRWNFVMFTCMAIVLGILVFGSLWIMNNLDYHMMSPHNTDTYIMQDEGIQPHNPSDGHSH